MTIKALKKEELALINELAEAVWFSTYTPILGIEQTTFMFHEIYSLTNLEKSTERFYVLIEEDIPLGFFSLKGLDKNYCKLNKIYVLLSAQKQGIGQAMLAKAEEIAKDEGYGILTLNVNRYNAALGFYKKHGFMVKQEVDIPIGKYFMNDYVLEKAI